MKYKVIKNFLKKTTCDNLIKDAIDLLPDNKFSVHGGRFVLTSTNINFAKLYNESKEWKFLIDKLNSQEFFDYCCKEIKVDTSRFKIVNFLNNYLLSKSAISYKRMNDTPLVNLNSLQIIKYLTYRIFKSIHMKFKLSVFNLSKFPVELLYDYSTALNGYRREIHRDSDNRLIVFLLYLNPISKEATGGSLDIYKLKDKNKTSFEAQPKNEDCELVEQIKPDHGKLVIFQNTDVSYHAVSEMKENKIVRHFLYGGFTILKGKNPFIKSSQKFKTPFTIYY